MTNLNKMKYRNYHNEPLRKSELLFIKKRIKEIHKIIHISENDDILDNLQSELDDILIILKKSHKAAKARQIGLKLVS